MSGHQSQGAAGCSEHPTIGVTVAVGVMVGVGVSPVAVGPVTVGVGVGEQHGVSSTQGVGGPAVSSAVGTSMVGDGQSGGHRDSGPVGVALG